MITSLEDFKVYNLALQLGEEVWAIVVQWNYFEKDTIGNGYIKSIGSSTANPNA